MPRVDVELIRHEPTRRLFDVASPEEVLDRARERARRVSDDERHERIRERDEVGPRADLMREVVGWVDDERGPCAEQRREVSSGGEAEDADACQIDAPLGSEISHEAL